MYEHITYVVMYKSVGEVLWQEYRDMFVAPDIAKDFVKREKAKHNDTRFLVVERTVTEKVI